MLYTLNLYDILYQLSCNKTERKIVLKQTAKKKKRLHDTQSFEFTWHAVTWIACEACSTAASTVSELCKRRHGLVYIFTPPKPVNSDSLPFSKTAVPFLFCSVIQLCPILYNPVDCSTPGYLPKCSNSCPLSWWCHPTILCYPLFLHSMFASIGGFSNESALCIR